MTNTLQIRLKRRTDSDTEYLFIELVVDDVPLVDFEYYATDLHELLASTERSEEYFLITCWCGVPSCARLNEGIHVHRELDMVHWYMPDPGPERRFVFERPHYDETIRKAIQEFKYWIVTNQASISNQRVIEVVPDSNSDFFNMMRSHS